MLKLLKDGALTFLTIISALGSFQALTGIIPVFKIESKILTSIFIIIFAISIFIIIFRRNRRCHYQIKSVNTSLHEINHLIRDEYHRIQDHIKSGQKINKQTIQNDCFQIVDYLSLALSHLSGDTVRSCIKILVPVGEEEQRPPKNADEAKVITLCRSKNTQVERFVNNREFPVNGNTDFEKIMKGAPFFKKGYLNKLYNSREYDNLSVDWNKYYLSTIVVPIRVCLNSANNDYDLLGFLCCDSENPKTFHDQKDDTDTNLVKAVADILYVLLDSGGPVI